jgi:hypothetical protein
MPLYRDTYKKNKSSFSNQIANTKSTKDEIKAAVAFKQEAIIINQLLPNKLPILPLTPREGVLMADQALAAGLFPYTHVYPALKNSVTVLANSRPSTLKPRLAKETEAMVAQYDAANAALPKREQLKVIPQDPIQAERLVKKFLTPDRINMIDGSPALNAAFHAAVKAEPALVHKAVAARQAAQRQACPVTKAEVKDLFGSLDA